jgi:biotin operon repressor
MVNFNNAMTEALGSQEVQVPRIEGREQVTEEKFTRTLVGKKTTKNPKSCRSQVVSLQDRIIKAFGDRSYPIKAKTIARIAGSTESSVLSTISHMKRSGVPIFTIYGKGYVLGHKPTRYDRKSA